MGRGEFLRASAHILLRYGHMWQWMQTVVAELSPRRWRLLRAALCSALSVASLVLGLLVKAPPAEANRFGPPWDSQVVAAQTTVYSRPDPTATAIGPLSRDQIVAVLSQTTGADGSAWSATPDGYVSSADIQEVTDPWIAEVTSASVSVYAKPNTTEGIRRTAQRGDLLRVTGMAPGLDGDTAIWWTTTEGYVGLHDIRQASSDWAQNWTMPDAAEAPQGWWGTLRSTGNVRAGATTSAPVVGSLGPGDRVKVLEEVTGQPVSGSAKWLRIDGGRYTGGFVHSSLITKIADPAPTPAPAPADAAPGPWIVVNRKAATLTLMRDGQPAFATYVSLGEAGVETPTGDYSTAGKFVADAMTSASVSDATHSYYLPNVPFTEYYRDGGYAIHGTYWHDQFGSVESQGCINVTVTDAAFLFGQTMPTVAADNIYEWAAADQATPVVILD